MATPYVTILRNVVPSTQDLAAAEMRSRRNPVLVIAGKQTAGRGRTGNLWWQATRGVAASLAFDLDVVDDTFTLMVGLAVRDAIATATGVTTDLKWPNDIELAGSKVGGILVERAADQVVVGVGLNVYWPDAPSGAGAVLGVDPGADLGRVISGMWAEAVLDPAARWDRHQYMAACATVGAQITWDPDGEGRAVDVDERGGLVVAVGGEQIVLRSGEVRAVRSSGDA